jgi:hypothetical protein
MQGWVYIRPRIHGAVRGKNLTNMFAYTYLADAPAVGFIFKQQSAVPTDGVTLDAKS